jgi:hypothetical protein
MRKQSKKTKKLLLDFIDAVIDWKVQLKSADIKIDYISYPKIYGEKDLSHHEDYDLWAIGMLNLISKWEWWEESERHYYNKFFWNK